MRADAVVRGHRSGLLSSSDYNNLAQCESLDDIKLNLVSFMLPHLVSSLEAWRHLQMQTECAEDHFKLSTP